MREDEAYDRLDKTENPGSVLMRLAFGRKQVAQARVAAHAAED